jgi:hypothetical protein
MDSGLEIRAGESGAPRPRREEQRPTGGRGARAASGRSKDRRRRGNGELAREDFNGGKLRFNKTVL